MSHSDDQISKDVQIVIQAIQEAREEVREDFLREMEKRQIDTDFQAITSKVGVFSLLLPWVYEVMAWFIGKDPNQTVRWLGVTLWLFLLAMFLFRLGVRLAKKRER